jgi:hypothetical protein
MWSSGTSPSGSQTSQNFAESHCNHPCMKTKTDNKGNDRGPRVLPDKLRVLSLAAGCISGLAGFFLFGIVFLVFPVLQILGAIIQPYSPRLGYWVLSAGVAILTASVGGFFGTQIFFIMRDIPHFHDPEILGVLFLFSLSLVLVVWVDVALIINERMRKKTA